MTYLPRRLRKRPAPQYLLKVPSVTAEEAKRLKEQWMRAQRSQVIVASSAIEVVKLR